LPSQADLIGTWRFISITEDATGTVHPLNTLFFMRFYSDGKCATWPVPKDEIMFPGAFSTDARRTSRGRYALEDGQLMFPDAPDSGKAQLRVSGNKMWYWTGEGYTCLYYRVWPDLEPGQLP
jgi:hypothetical protein